MIETEYNVCRRNGETRAKKEGMARGQLESQIAALNELKMAGATPEAVRVLGKALTHRNNYYVSKAAAVVEQLGLQQLLPDLIAAYNRFFEQEDPQCWAKAALSKALAELSCEDPAPFVRGISHIQMEPVYGGRVDTAGTLRAHSAMGLVGCRGLSDFDVLRHLTPALLDAERIVRVEASRAVVQVGRAEGALLLQLRALQGDEEPEVAGAVLSGIIALEGGEGIRFVARFLDAQIETAEQAALSLGESRSPEALEILRRCLEDGAPRDLGRVLFTSIALTRLPEATAYLIHLIRKGAPGARDAKQALLEYGALSEDDRKYLAMPIT